MGKQNAGGGEPIGGGGEEAVVAKDGVNVNEELLEKAHEEDAQEQIEALEARVAELEAALLSAEEAIVLSERRGEIDRELTAARAVDLETARLLTEAVISEMDEPDVALAVRDLCERKPFLFSGKRHGGSGISMSPTGAQGGGDARGAMAQQARSSGERSELLRYLRARRV